MSEVLRYRDCDQAAVSQLINSLGLNIKLVEHGEEIPGSFWGDDEAGLIRNTLYIRPDTPVHSVLHEACHFACMDDKRRASLHTHAGGDAMEENAVCYLQILLSDAVPGLGRERIFKDMDSWGYCFRLGSARAWFERDAEDALLWLQDRGLTEFAEQLTHAHGVADLKV